MIPRPLYIERLLYYRDKDLIKVLSGLRRVGKSTLLELFRQRLLEGGVAAGHIVSVNFEDPKYSHIKTHQELYSYVTSQLPEGVKGYVFLDEVQQLESFERAVDGLYLNKDIDVYITGSNTHLLSGSLATLLSGRHIEIPVYPLSFKEYASAHDEAADARLLQRYMRFGGLPYTLAMTDDQQAVFDYLGGVFNTVVQRDIMVYLKASHPAAFNEIVRFLFDNIGNTLSIKKVSDTLASAGMKVSPPTVSRYIAALQEAFVLQKASRYDLKGRRYLQSQEKYYLTDLGLRYYLLGDRQGDLGHLLENVVFMELKRRSHDVAIGKSYSHEVDFMATGSSGVAYYQVAASVLDPQTLGRELQPLQAIRDNYPKYLLTLDEVGTGSHQGIEQVNVLDWLLSG